MTYSNHKDIMRMLAEDEGVFTAAQAKRAGVTLNALSYAASHGILERIAFGAYRLIGSQSTPHDELTALWKLTNPEKYTFERMPQQNWDGFAVGGRTAACVHEIGDFEIAPYLIYTPKRFNSRKSNCAYKVRTLDRRDVSFTPGFPATRPERTIVDMLIDQEERSLVADAYRDACNKTFDHKRFLDLMEQHFGSDESQTLVQELDAEAGFQREG